MDQFKFYKIAALGLLVLNLCLIAFFLFNRPPEMGTGAKFQSTATELLHLNTQQEKLFLEEAQNHSSTLIDLNNKQQALLKPFFNSYLENKAAPDSILTQIKNIEEQKLSVTISHFDKIKSFLKPEQQTYFKEFTRKAIERIVYEPQGQPQGPPPGGAPGPPHQR